MHDEPTLASHAAAIIHEQRYAAKQAKFMEAQRARRQAGIRFTTPDEQRARGRASAREGKWTREQVIAILRAHHAEHGDWPSGHSWEKRAPDRPTTDTVRRLFGKWSTAIEEAQG